MRQRTEERKKERGVGIGEGRTASLFIHSLIFYTVNSGDLGEQNLDTERNFDHNMNKTGSYKKNPLHT